MLHKTEKNKCQLCKKADNSPCREEATSCQTETYEDGNWTSETTHILKQFTYLSIVEHAKIVAGLLQVMLKSLWKKRYKFFYESYCHNVLCKCKDDKILIKGKCYRSLEKTANPYNVFAVLSLTRYVTKATCACPAEANGYCNHSMALLYLIDHVTKLKCKEFPKVGTCTDNPQKWHKPRTEGISPEPVMGCTFINPKYTNRPYSGLKSSLYEARQPTVQNNDGANELLEKLKQINPSLGFCSVYSDQPFDSGHN